MAAVVNSVVSLREARQQQAPDPRSQPMHVCDMAADVNSKVFPEQARQQQPSTTYPIGRPPTNPNQSPAFGVVASTTSQVHQLACCRRLASPSPYMQAAVSVALSRPSTSKDRTTKACIYCTLIRCRGFPKKLSHPSPGPMCPDPRGGSAVAGALVLLPTRVEQIC